MPHIKFLPHAKCTLYFLDNPTLAKLLTIIASGTGQSPGFHPHAAETL